jgi:hypothetical protein
MFLPATPSSSSQGQALPPTPNATEMVQGLEALGPVQVMVMRMELGVPSATNETVYAPFETVRIVVPPGAWVPRIGRGLAPLTLTVFVLPPSAGAPGETCGAAVDLGPRDQMLALPISVSLPCATPARGRPFRLDAERGVWEASTPLALEKEGAVWGSTLKLGVHSALMAPSPEPPAWTPAVTLGGSGDSQMGTALGASFGGLAVATLVVGTIVAARRRHAKGEKQTRVTASIDTDLCFTTAV